MNGIDIAIIVILAIGLIRGIVKGLINELASLLSVVLGIIGAYHFADLLHVYLNNWFDWDAEYLQLFSFILIFLAIIVIVTLIGKAITHIISYVALSLVNRILGGVFGCLKIALILLVIGLIFMTLNQGEMLVSKEKLNESMMYTLIEKKIITHLPSLVEFAKENNYISPESDINLPN